MRNENLGPVTNIGDPNLTWVPLGYLAERALLGGGGKFCPLSNSQTSGCSKVGGTAIESSQRVPLKGIQKKIFKMLQVKSRPH